MADLIPIETRRAVRYATGDLVAILLLGVVDSATPRAAAKPINADLPFPADLPLPAPPTTGVPREIRRLPVPAQACRPTADRGVEYCRGRIKRVFDAISSLAAIVALAPLFVVIAAAVRLSSRGPILFRQERIGLDGRPFALYKFRTMRPNDGRGPLITAKGDRRITPIGRVLRSTKLDELPQLLNVLKGEMSVVGPRPQTRRDVACYTAWERRTLAVRPGLTDPATILLRNQEAILETVTAKEMERFYTSKVLPRRLASNLDYIEQAGFLYDLKLISETLRVILVPSRRSLLSARAAAGRGLAGAPLTAAGVAPRATA